MPFDGSNYDSPVTNPVTELLEQAWRLIDRHQKWTRGQPESEDGRRRCSLSALQTAAIRRPDVQFPSHIIALVMLTTAMGRHGPAMATNIAAFNDSHSHAEVANAWQRAIAASRTLP